jgi:hypothetical protein
VFYRDNDLVAGRVFRGPHGRGVFHPQPLIPADEVQADVAGERPGQQPCLTQHLKSVADTEDGQPVAGRVHDHADHGREPRYRSGPEIVAVGESTGQHHSVHPGQISVTVPEHDGLATGDADRAGGVPVIEGTGKCDHTNP